MTKYTEPRWSEAGYYDDVEHLVLEVTGDPIIIDFKRAIDDLMISTPDGDILVSWKLDHETELDENHSMLISMRDNLKEISGIKTTLLGLRAKDVHATLKVYITVQRN